MEETLQINTGLNSLAHKAAVPIGQYRGGHREADTMWSIINQPFNTVT